MIKNDNLLENKKQKVVYVGMCADFLHHGHMRVIEEANKLGDIVIGLLTDEAMATYKRVPLLPYEHREMLARNLKGVSRVVKQESLDYVPNLMKIKPDYVVHGDDWKIGVQKSTRQRVIEVLAKWGGELVEIENPGDMSSTKINSNLRKVGFTPEMRMKRFRRLLNIKPLLRAIEAHNGLTALIAENVCVDKQGMKKEFDCIWISSLTDSISKGKPDTGLIDFTSRLNTIEQILESTTKPIIIDGDNGGDEEHFVFMVKTLERLGVSAIIIEDKTALKRNSLFRIDTGQVQEEVSNFANKISEGKKYQRTDEFMIIARIESLILNKGIYDALLRAKAYILAGADAIMIHSNKTDGREIFEFCEEYSKIENKVPLVVVPTTYSHIKEEELIDAGINIVIYANHLLRSAYPAMKKTAESILLNERAYEAGEFCMSIKEILTLIPEK